MIKKERVDIAKALAHIVRDSIVGILRECSLNVEEIRCKLRIPQPQVSQHLLILKNAGLVKLRKDGVFHIYSANEKKICEYLESFKKGGN